MKPHRTWSLPGFMLVLSLIVSCTASEMAPTEASLDRVALDDPKIISADDPGLLTCSPQSYQVATKILGPKGGRIKVGTHVLQIPAGALSQDVTIVAEQVPGSANSVRFSPEGLTFAQPAELTLSYSNCSSVSSAKSIVYTDEQLDILEQLDSQDNAQSKTVVSPIDHFSRYAVAY